MASSRAPEADAAMSSTVTPGQQADEDSEWEYEYSTTETEVRVYIFFFVVCQLTLSRRFT